jgi:hypothetical protein
VAALALLAALVALVAFYGPRYLDERFRACTGDRVQQTISTRSRGTWSTLNQNLDRGVRLPASQTAGSDTGAAARQAPCPIRCIR